MWRRRYLQDRPHQSRYLNEDVGIPSRYEVRQAEVAWARWRPAPQVLRPAAGSWARMPAGSTSRSQVVAAAYSVSPPTKPHSLSAVFKTLFLFPCSRVSSRSEPKLRLCLMPSSSSSSSLLFPAEKPKPRRGSSHSSLPADSPRTPIDERTPLMHAAKKQRNRKSSQGRRSTGQLTKTEIRINVYDLLPPSRVASMLWRLGTSLLHSGVVIGDKEYAFGGHDQPRISGVYWTKPRLEPPGGTFRMEILHGFSYLPVEDIEGVVREVRRPICPNSH